MTRRRGRPYQPYKPRNRQWVLRLLVVVVAVGIALTAVAFSFTR